MMGQKKSPLTLMVVLVIGLVPGMSNLVLLPPWQHYDEPIHFEYA